VTLYIGTSGWAYKEWKPGFYPADLPQSRFLEHYGSVLSACEINATFYRRQEESTFDRWASSTPAPFRFATKAHRGLTHGRGTIYNPEKVQFLQEFLQSVGRLGPKLGAVLFQFPPTRPRDDQQLEGLLNALEGRMPFALEFRHDSWDATDVRERVAFGGGTVCIGHTEGPVPESLPPGRLAYVRLRDQHYEDERRDRWLELFTREAENRDVFAFTKHEGIPAGDPYGGIGLAQWLVQRVTAPADQVDA
jgi:uncharacterized protein YecE (DUF72 family)